MSMGNIGIIGGTDGPTAVFISREIGKPVAYIIGAVLIIATVIFIIIRKKKK